MSFFSNVTSFPFFAFRNIYIYLYTISVLAFAKYKKSKFYGNKQSFRKNWLVLQDSLISLFLSKSYKFFKVFLRNSWKFNLNDLIGNYVNSCVNVPDYTNIYSMGFSWTNDFLLHSEWKFSHFVVRINWNILINERAPWKQRILKLVAL